jgi:hypothetical protein
MKKTKTKPLIYFGCPFYELRSKPDDKNQQVQCRLTILGRWHFHFAVIYVDLPAGFSVTGDGHKGKMEALKLAAKLATAMN